MTRLLRFGAVAALGTVSDVAVMAALRYVGLPVIVAVAAGWSASLVVGFILNGQWVFSSGDVRGDPGAAVRYAALSAVNALVAIVGVSWAVAAGLPYVAVRLGASVALLTLNFFVCRTWVFRDRPGPMRVPGYRDREPCAAAEDEVEVTT